MNDLDENRQGHTFERKYNNHGRPRPHASHGPKSHKRKIGLVILLFLIATAIFYFEIPIPYIESESLTVIQYTKYDILNPWIDKIQDSKVYRSIVHDIQDSTVYCSIVHNIQDSTVYYSITSIIHDIKESVGNNMYSTIPNIITSHVDNIQEPSVNNTPEPFTNNTPEPFTNNTPEPFTNKIPEPSIDNARNTIPRDVQSTISESVSDRTKSGFSPAQIEYYILYFTNQNRLDHGLPELERISDIDDIARDHSEDMALREYFEHESPEGYGPGDRGNFAGYPCRKDYVSYYTVGLAENIAMEYTYTSYSYFDIDKPISYRWHSDEKSLAFSTVDGWMNSPGHRENILDSSYDKIGIGVYLTDDEAVYSTQNFC